MRKRKRQKRLGHGIYNWIELYKARKRETIYNFNLYKTRKRERQKKVGKGVFLLYNYKCIGRKYMYFAWMLVFLSEGSIFSRFLQTQTKFIHFALVCISERGEGGKRD